MGGAEVFPCDFLVDGLEVEEEARDEVRGQATYADPRIYIQGSGQTLARTQLVSDLGYARLGEQRDEADSL